MRGGERLRQRLAQAFGFSLTVTVSFGVVSLLQPPTGLFHLVLVALAGVVAVSLVDGIAAWLLVPAAAGMVCEGPVIVDEPAPWGSEESGFAFNIAV